MEYVAFDTHKRYTLASVARPDGHVIREQRIDHDRGALRQFLERCAPGSPGAVARHLAEATYWMLSKHEPYREPRSTAVSSTRDKRG